VSADPTASPLIRMNHLSDHRDIKRMEHMVQKCRLLAAEISKTFGAIEVSPNVPTLYPDTETHLRATAKSAWHAVGTCKMGPADDFLAVVDSRLRVRGVRRLRVIDASVMPQITSGNTNAPALMIGTKGAEMILQDTPM